MKISEKVNFILSTLKTLFPVPDITLEHEDPFTLLISVILSAQCTDARVNQVTKTLFKIANNPLTMSKLPFKELANIIRPCGLVNHKTNAILRTSNILSERFHGNVPDTFEELESLPGVGHKTASVVMAQAFHKPAFPVDTHIARLSVRWGLSDSKNVRKVEESLKLLFPQETWHDAHIQMIRYGRQYCPARNHNISKCIICKKFNNEI